MIQTIVASARGGGIRPAICALLFLVAATAQADWLVLQNGERLETRGTWTVKGKQIVYTAPDKSLRSLRLSEVDLEASHRASAAEPGRSKGYQDLGEAPDIANVKAPSEFNQLDAWISNPNAPRVSGTVSAPGLQVSQEELAREGLRILEDPAAVQTEMMQSASAIDAQYDQCQKTHAVIGDNYNCGQDYDQSAAALRSKAYQVYAAVDAARRAQAAEAKAESDDAAESQQIEARRNQEEQEAKEAAAKKPAASPRPPR